MTMSFSSYTQGHLVPVQPAQGAHTTPDPCQLSQKLPVRQLSRVEWMDTQRLRRLIPSRSALDSRCDSSLENMAPEYAWSEVPMACPELAQTPCGQVAMGNEQGGNNKTSFPAGPWHTPQSEGSGCLYVNDETKAPPSVPMAPRIGRLRTPELLELEPAKKGSRFCSCCQPVRSNYEEGRAKMDSQRELTPLCKQLEGPRTKPC